MRHDITSPLAASVTRSGGCADVAVGGLAAQAAPAADERAARLSRSAESAAEARDFEGARRHLLAESALRQQLAARHPDRRDWQRDLSLCHSRLGDALLELGERDTALVHHRADLDFSRRLAVAEPNDQRAQRICVSLTGGRRRDESG